MREMHKWKDKVEMSLDNRQIFFLFFGLSVVGCFVFALGVMVGRRVDWNPEGQVAALAGDSLAVLDEQGGDGPGDDEPAFTFTEGLKAPATIGVPETRTVAEAERGFKDPDPQSVAASDQTLVNSSPATKPTLPKGNKSSVDPARTGKIFTLQMKAFSREDEANSFADRLRRNGHDVRVEATEVRGRLWHRVRMGSFKQWDNALTAKTDFEKSEHIIAYVVRE
jgi:cell division septation protein DedD